MIGQVGHVVYTNPSIQLETYGLTSKFITTTLLSEVYQLSTDLDHYPLFNVAPLHVWVVVGLLDCDGAVVSVSVATVAAATVATVVGAAGGRGRAVVRDGG